MQYIVQRDFEPFGILKPTGDIQFFDDYHEKKLQKLVTIFYQRTHDSNGNRDIIEPIKNPDLKDVVIFLQTRGFMVRPIDNEFLQLVRSELEKL